MPLQVENTLTDWCHKSWVEEPLSYLFPKKYYTECATAVSAKVEQADRRCKK